MLKTIVARYFALRRLFPSMKPSNAWFHASVQDEIATFHASA